MLLLLRMLWRSALVLGLAHLTLATRLQKRWDDFVEKHSWAEIPSGWNYVAHAPPDYEFDLRIGLKQDKFDKLIADLSEISDPFHPR